MESALKSAALWDEVKDDLKKSAQGISGGQQQRLCIARALAVKPKILLMDEPCSALDPISTMKIEELFQTLRQQLTVVIVTHNMQQAARVSDYTAFFNTDESRIGRLVNLGRQVRFLLLRAIRVRGITFKAVSVNTYILKLFQNRQDACSTTDKYFCGAGILPAIVMFSEQARCLFHHRQIFLWSRHLACYSYVFNTA